MHVKSIAQNKVCATNSAKQTNQSRQANNFEVKEQNQLRRAVFSYAVRSSATALTKTLTSTVRTVVHWSHHSEAPLGRPVKQTKALREASAKQCCALASAALTQGPVKPLANRSTAGQSGPSFLTFIYAPI